MKKLLALCLLFCLCLVVTGCTSDDKKEEKNPEVIKEKDLLVEMKTTLTDAGYTISKETKMDASLIGGVEGIKYTTDKGKVEIYKFEKTSEGYKKAESGKVTLEGFGDFDAKTNNGYVLLTQDLPTDIIDAFANMK